LTICEKSLYDDWCCGYKNIYLDVKTNKMITFDEIQSNPSLKEDYDKQLSIFERYNEFVTNWRKEHNLADNACVYDEVICHNDYELYCDYYYNIRFQTYDYWCDTIKGETFETTQKIGDVEVIAFASYGYDG